MRSDITRKIRTTSVFNGGDGQAVRIPVDVAYDRDVMEVEIERVGDEIRIRPARRSLAGVLKKFAQFVPGFTVGMRDGHGTAEREEL